MKAKKINFKSESGFTLMELMVVIGVLAILIAILLPQFSGYTAKAQAISAASEVKNALTAGYSYYVTSTARGTNAFDLSVAKTKMTEAVKSAGTVDTSGGAASVKYSTTKGDLTFEATLDVQTGTVVGGSMTCSGGGANVCKTLTDEGDLKVE